MLELGGGDNPHPSSDLNVDVRPANSVAFTVDFEQFPWAISSNEWDAVYSAFCLEHITYTKVPQFLAECKRVLKGGGHLILLLPNTEAQIKWLQDHPDGWDGKDAFTSMSELIFGTQDYSANAHKSFFTPAIITKLLTDAGFERVMVSPYGDRDTDMGVQAFKPTNDILPGNTTVCPRCQGVVPHTGAATLQCHLCNHSWGYAGTLPPAGWQSKPVDQLQQPGVVNIKDGNIVTTAAPEAVRPHELVNAEPGALFDKLYFNGGGKVGGYAREGYRDFPIHWVTFDHIMARRPASVLELGAARGYLVKRLQDAGVRAGGLEVSLHCWLTRVAENVYHQDLCKPWLVPHPENYDLAFSIAVFEHIPEAALPHVFAELKKYSQRGLHGIDFGGKDDGWDKTHVTLKSKNWWIEQFNKHGLTTHEIVDKEELERGDIQQKYLTSEHNQVKLNLGSHMVMAHHGWMNHDAIDLSQFAQTNGYQFKPLDLTRGLPYSTGGVDLIAMSHVLEHFPYDVGARLLKECRRVLKPTTGAMRIAVPDAGKLMGMYADRSHFQKEWEQFGEMNDGVAKAPTVAAKLWALLHEGHHACYDAESLLDMLDSCGFTATQARFREPGFENNPGCDRLLKETLDCFPPLTLYVSALPRV